MTWLALLVIGCGAVERPLPARAAPCPDSPNCVSSVADPADDVHHVRPLHEGEPEAARRVFQEARAAALELPRATLVDEDDGWVHVAVTTPLLRFRDDLEVWLDGGTVHVRSASRVGHSDLGANRARVETLRERIGAGRSGAGR